MAQDSEYLDGPLQCSMPGPGHEKEPDRIISLYEPDEYHCSDDGDSRPHVREEDKKTKGKRRGKKSDRMATPCKQKLYLPDGYESSESDSDGFNDRYVTANMMQAGFYPKKKKTGFSRF